MTDAACIFLIRHPFPRSIRSAASFPVAMLPVTTSVVPASIRCRVTVDALPVTLAEPLPILPAYAADCIRTLRQTRGKVSGWISDGSSAASKVCEGVAVAATATARGLRLTIRTTTGTLRSCNWRMPQGVAERVRSAACFRVSNRGPLARYAQRTTRVPVRVCRVGVLKQNRRSASITRATSADPAAADCWPLQTARVLTRSASVIATTYYG